jgi:hypothetical protein
MGNVRDRIVDGVSNAIEERLEDGITAGADKIQEVIQDKLGRMLNVVTKSTSTKQSLDRFAGVNEEEILTFNPDKRSFAGAGPLLLGILCLLIFPGILKLAAVVLFIAAIIFFLVGYVNNAKVDIPDGYEGVKGYYGKPLPDEKANSGRTWLLNFAKFVPFLVSKRDQVVDTANANFTGDFASIAFYKQIVFRVVDSAKFVSNTSPAAIMKILDMYSSYLSLRMVTSIQDARVKFIGRDRLVNVINALNAYLSDEFGIEVIRVNMPGADNDVLDDLESIRTKLKEISARKETRQVRLESAIKAVESQIRTKTKETRSKALELQQAQIRLETTLAERINTSRQEFLIKVRRRLEEGASNLRMEILTFKAKLVKAKAIRESLPGLETALELREAAIKRKIFRLQVPKRVDIISVPGIGAGVGLSFGQELLNRLNKASDDAPTTLAPAQQVLAEASE